ncbi:hypothetical protein ACQB60_04290 [Actinomycetota bacterium Odt1-20B]
MHLLRHIHPGVLLPVEDEIFLKVVGPDAVPLLQLVRCVLGIHDQGLSVRRDTFQCGEERFAPLAVDGFPGAHRGQRSLGRPADRRVRDRTPDRADPFVVPPLHTADAMHADDGNDHVTRVCSDAADGAALQGAHALVVGLAQRVFGVDDEGRDVLQGASGKIDPVGCQYGLDPSLLAFGRDRKRKRLVIDGRTHALPLPRIIRNPEGDQ